MIDVARLRKELEYVTAHRDEWRQNTWLERTTCGTVGCVAGNAVLHAGYEPVYGRNTSRSDAAAYLHDPAHTTRSKIRPIADVARELFGLSEYQAGQLFHPQNSLYELWRFAERFTGGEITVPEDVRAEHARERHRVDVVDW